MNFIHIDDNGIYQGMVEGIAGDIPGSWFSPAGVRISSLGNPPTDEPGAWRDDGAVWVAVVPPTLEEAQKDAFEKLKAKRLAVEYAGPLVPYNGDLVRFPSEVKDETRLNSLAGMFMVDDTLVIPDWKVADGVYVDMTATLLQTVKVAGFQHIASTFSIERAKREQIEALKTTKAVDTWLETQLDAGWPE